ncbi:MAG: hypothetical protein IJW99_07410 [Clostridia bacterium]|nr:hypothetical protein [Clostridia bacterium]
MIFSYSIKHLRRHFKEGLLSVTLVAVIAVLLLGLLHFLDGQAAQLEHIYDTFEITCELSNATGTQTKDISIGSHVADMFLDGGVLTPYAKDVHMETDQRAILWSEGVNTITPLPETVVEMVATNDPTGSEALSGCRIEYAEGYSFADFGGADALCLVPPSMEDALREGELLLCTNSMSPVSFRVAGVLYGAENNVICASFAGYRELMHSRAQNPSPHASSLRFVIRDNRALNEAKAAFGNYFMQTDKTVGGGEGVGLMIYDSVFIDSVTVLERSVALFRIVLVLLYLLSVALCFFGAYLTVRGRRQEFAIMCSMGTYPFSAYVSALWEHGIFFLIGGGLGIGLAALFGYAVNGSNILHLVGFACCYLLSVCLAVAQVTAGDIVTVLKGKE